MSKRVPCCVCNLPIHIDEFGGVFGVGDGKEYWYHDQCSVEAMKLMSIKRDTRPKLQGNKKGDKYAETRNEKL